MRPRNETTRTAGGNFECNGFTELDSPDDFDLGLDLAQREDRTRRMREWRRGAGKVSGQKYPNSSL